MTKTVARLLTLATCGSVIGLLAGCDTNIYQSPGAIRLNGQDVEFAVCEPIDGARLIVVGDKGPGEPATTYMEAAGPVRLRPGAPLSSSAVPDGLTSTNWATPDVSTGSRIALFIYDVDGRVEYPIEFTVPAGGLSDSDWTRATGDQRADPCD